MDADTAKRIEEELHRIAGLVNTLGLDMHLLKVRLKALEDWHNETLSSANQGSPEPPRGERE